MISLIVLFLTAACVVPSSLSGILQQAPAESTSAAPGTEETSAPEPATQIAAVRATSTSAPPPTFTATLPPTLRPSSTPWPTFTPVPAVAIPRRAVCDQNGFVSDVTIPDGSSIPGGSQSVKTWKIKNTGSCTWDTGYTITFYKGDSIVYTAKPLSREVAPGETVEVTVTFTAPTKEGHYRTYFQMIGKRGKPFLGSFYVDFNVVTLKTPTPDPNVRYEFAARQCDATWANGSSKVLPCPSANGSADGFMLFVVNPVLESGYVDNEPGLLMNPPTVTNGIIGGLYPPITIQPGDSFRSIIGCERGATKCDVRFDLGYMVGDSVYIIGSWMENYNEAYTQLNIDLTPLAGQTVQFVLTVSSNGVSDGDRGLWLRPRIYEQ